MTTAPKCPVCEAAHAMTVGGKQCAADDFIRAAIVQERKAKEKAEAERDELRAECERLRRVRDAAAALRKAEADHDAQLAECNRDGRAPSGVTVARIAKASDELNAALRAAGGGG